MADGKRAMSRRGICGKENTDRWVACPGRSAARLRCAAEPGPMPRHCSKCGSRLCGAPRRVLRRVRDSNELALQKFAGLVQRTKLQSGFGKGIGGAFLAVNHG